MTEQRTATPDRVTEATDSDWGVRWSHSLGETWGLTEDRARGLSKQWTKNHPLPGSSSFVTTVLTRETITITRRGSVREVNT